MAYQNAIYFIFPWMIARFVFLQYVVIHGHLFKFVHHGFLNNFETNGVIHHSVLERIWIKGSYLSQWLPQGERGPPKESKLRWIEILHGGSHYQKRIFSESLDWYDKDPPISGQALILFSKYEIVASIHILPNFIASNTLYFRPILATIIGSDIFCIRDI